ncbi:MAG TPA: polyphosphate kinase 1 [Acidimicrobiales bacterium]|jgi:polyphosphate kinase|nr:polyphosphate kinase 1 [Acidimicrobiales bacterium]
MATTHAGEPVDAGNVAVASAARLGIAVAPPGVAVAATAVNLPPIGGAEDQARRYVNRELSTLDYFGRVLAIAEDTAVPVLERAKFLAIFQGLLDEFFEVRVAGLMDQLAAGLLGTDPAGLSPADQLRAIRRETATLVERRVQAFLGQVVPELDRAGIHLSSWDALDEDDRGYIEAVFEERIFPVLTPLAVDPSHPFPYISNLSLNLAVIVSDPVTHERRFARVKVPPLLPGFVVTPDGERFVPLDSVIAAHLAALFPGMEIESHHPFRVTRNADLTLQEDEADDLLEAVEMELRRRRFGRAVRLEIEDAMTDEVRTLLCRELDVADDDVYVIQGPLDLAGLWAVHAMDRPDLKDEPFVPETPARLMTANDEPADIFGAIRQGDILLHHPYDSFATSVEAFIKQAAKDPRVLAIKQTLYRTSGDSPIVKALIRAAERGKQVAALVELKARGDEAANVQWARQLEEAGVHVVYGLLGLKTHSKAALVVRDEDDGIRRYCHIGTGNYNSTTARQYEDLGMLTVDADVGADLTDLFNFLTGYSRRTEYRKIILAPLSLRNAMIKLVERQAARGEQGRLIWKMNNLVDPAIIDALYAASHAGVRVTLIIRGICCLRPGVPGLSENIEVRSIVGRWLEHSRIYYFGAGVPPHGGRSADDGADPAAPAHHAERPEQGPTGTELAAALPPGGDFYIGSADMMPRNLDRRVECIVPVTDSEGCRRLREIVAVELADDALAWEMRGDGTWEKVPTVRGFNAQRYFQDDAVDRARRRREPDPLNQLGRGVG